MISSIPIFISNSIVLSKRFFGPIFISGFGIFVRLCKRDNKSNYLKYLPYTWEVLELRLKNPIFINLKRLLDKVAHKKDRKKFNFNDN